MSAAAKPDNRHPGRNGSRDANGAVFDDDAMLARRIELPGREKEEIGSRLSPLDLRGAKDVWLEERQQAGYRQRVADPIEVAVRSDAARRRQCGEQLFDTRYRGQLARERDIDMGAETLEKVVPQTTPESGLDLGGQGEAVLAKTEHHRFVHRDRKVGGDQALAENSAENDLAVDQHTIAIEDDEIRQKRSLKRAGGYRVYGPGS